MRKFAYYKAGDQLAIVENQISTETGTDVEYTNEWNSPESDLNSGILLEYAATVTAPTAESSDIDVSRVLALAIVDYVKAKFMEDAGNVREYIRLMSNFRKKISIEYRNKLGGRTILIPKGIGVLK